MFEHERELKKLQNEVERLRSEVEQLKRDKQEWKSAAHLLLMKLDLQHKQGAKK